MVFARYIRFVESSAFTKGVTQLVGDEVVWGLQMELAANPAKGRLVQGTGGLRKVRMPARGKGKSGGARVMYLYLATPAVIYLLYVYDKDEAEDLTPAQKRELRAIGDAIKKEYRDER